MTRLTRLHIYGKRRLCYIKPAGSMAISIKPGMGMMPGLRSALTFS